MPFLYNSSSVSLLYRWAPCLHVWAHFSDVVHHTTAASSSRANVTTSSLPALTRQKTAAPPPATACYVTAAVVPAEWNPLLPGRLVRLGRRQLARPPRHRGPARGPRPGSSTSPRLPSPRVCSRRWRPSCPSWTTTCTRASAAESACSAAASCTRARPTSRPSPPSRPVPTWSTWCASSRPGRSSSPTVPSWLSTQFWTRSTPWRRSISGCPGSTP